VLLLARAKRARELSDRREEPDLGPAAEPHNGSMREILEAGIRDPNTSARDLASLTNALAHLKDGETLASGPPIYHLRRGTLILELEPTDPGSERTYRLMLRVCGGIDHVADGLTNSAADLAWPHQKISACRRSRSGNASHRFRRAAQNRSCGYASFDLRS